MNEKTIEIANKMYSARRSALSLLGPEEFKKKMAEYRKYIEGAMKKHGCEEIMAVMEILKVLQEKRELDTTVTQMFILAACVEMIDPYEVS